MTKKSKTIEIEKEFSRFPLGRDEEDGGDFNGKKFRKEFLVPSLNENDEVIVYLDGPKGYGSSFLEEAFGGLVRKENFTKADLKSRLKITYDAPVYELYKNEVWEYIDEA